MSAIDIIDGEFGRGKTLIMARDIYKKLKNPKNIIFTNIKVRDADTYDNLYYFQETKIIENERTKKKEIYMGMVDVLHYIGQIDDLWRKQQEEYGKRNNMTFYEVQDLLRKNKLAYYIYMDEGGIVFNQHLRKSFPLEMYDELLQIRKINVRIYIASQKMKNIVTNLREHAQRVYYFEPLFGRNIFKNRFGSLRMRIPDEEDPSQPKVVNIPKRQRDGSIEIVQKVHDYHVERITKPKYFKFYDDLRLNKKITERKLLYDYTDITNYITDQFKRIFLLETSKKSLLSFKKPVLPLTQDENVETIDKLLNGDKSVHETGSQSDTMSRHDSGENKQETRKRNPLKALENATQF